MDPILTLLTSAVPRQPLNRRVPLVDFTEKSIYALYLGPNRFYYGIYIDRISGLHFRPTKLSAYTWL